MANNSKLISSKKLMLLITIVKRNKADYYIDLIEDQGVNMQMISFGNGTTKSTLFTDEIGTKVVLFSVGTEDVIKKVMKLLKEKFLEIRGGKGVCWCVPLTSVMGVTFFNFLSNNKGNRIG